MSGIKTKTTTMAPWTIADRTTDQDLFVFVLTTLDSTKSSNMAWTSRATAVRLGCGSSANDGLLTSKLAPHHYDGGGNAETGVCSYHNSHHHSKREAAENFATHQIEDENGEESEAARQDGARKRLIDGAIHNLDERLAAHQARVLAHAVEDYDCVVHRISDQR